MPVAIEFFLDDASATVVRETWRALAEAGVSAYLNESGVRPHLTLTAGSGVDATTESRLRDFAAETPPPSVTFASLGVSPGEQPNLFLTPIVTADLLDLHRRFLDRFAGLIAAPSERYAPGRWVPHCTLVEHVSSDLVARAVEVCRRSPLPLEARLVEIGVVEWRPVRQICAFNLAHSPPRGRA